MFDRTAKPLPSEPMFSALKNEIERQLKPQFPDMVTHVALGSNPQLSYREQRIDTQKLLGHKSQKMTDKYHDDRGKDWQIIAV